MDLLKDYLCTVNNNSINSYYIGQNIIQINNYIKNAILQ